MGDSMNELKLLASHLNRESDAITHTIQQIQDKLNNLKMGIPVWLEDPIPMKFQSDKKIPPHAGFCLGYSKTKEGWGLVVRRKPLRAAYRVPSGGFDHHWSDDLFLSEQPMPLLKTSRSLRVIALKHIPKLIRRMVKAAKELNAEMEKMKESPLKVRELGNSFKRANY